MGYTGQVNLSMVLAGKELVSGDGAVFETNETGHDTIVRKTAVANTTTTWTLPAFTGRGTLFLRDITNPEGDGTVTCKVNTNHASNEVLNIKPVLMLSQSPTTIYLINSHATVDTVIELIGITDEDLA